ncbi:MAG: ribonuclease R [Corallococcus sp.]|nr:ribonuclease R [Corallococcus sp.]MCM1359760.1 ribonuclease R [Corallococcus sp.]MCM1395714.1 ribonuclease R [Corallococcus sp.]
MNFEQKILQIIKDADWQYFTARQVCGILQTKSSFERKAVSAALNKLTQDCLLVFDGQNRRYRLVTEQDFGRAVFDANQRGFGFLLREDGEDLFVPANKTHGAFHRDTVLYARVHNTTDCAEVVKIISRGITQIVGTYDKTENARFVVPDEAKFASDIYILPKRDMGAKNGQKVVAKILNYPKDNRNSPEGEIVQVLGYPDQKDVDMLSVAYAFGLNKDFSNVCESEAAALPQRVLNSDVTGRRDLRKQTVFTIDGADAKDLDDAISIRKNADGTCTLGVHIADVSHYVKEGGAIDREAFQRGTSVYFPQTVFPMLPTALSNGICSLYAGEDRLTLSCEMLFDNRGKVLQYDIFPSVINSSRRLTYDEVQAVFDGDKQTMKRLSDVCDDLFEMKRLAETLIKKRIDRGCIDFASREVNFVYDESGKVVDVVPYERKFSHQLIEEFMVAANVCVAEYAESCQIPFVYRVHEKPDEQKYADLLTLMQGVGIKVKRSKQIHNSVLQDALVQAQNTPYFNFINEVTLRTMQKAKYSQANSGHFGLACETYCHFTSPIRRYPDLTVHRILKTLLRGEMTDAAIVKFQDVAAETSAQCCARERLADEAERKADDVKKCAYAQTVIGRDFAATISGVTERGIFCQLANTVEGFVPVEKLGDKFVYNPKKFCLVSPAKTFALGDSVNVAVTDVNMQAAKIYFDLLRSDGKTRRRKQ